MDIEEVRTFLTETEEGKQLVEEFKQPLLSKKDELLRENRRLGEKLTSEAQRAQDTEKLLTDERAALHQHVVDGEMNRLMAEHNVLPRAEDAVRSAIKARNTITLENADGGGRKAMIETEDGSKTLEDYFSEWAKSDEAKLYLRAEGSFGGGAPGSGGRSSGSSDAGGDFRDQLRASMKMESNE